ncbi:MAG: hypothetical protein AAF657_28210 [Acidobacteriota bacterium]
MRNFRGTKFLLAVAMLLLAVPAQATTFDLASPTYVVGKTSTTITVLILVPFEFKVLDCPSTGVLSKYCDIVEIGDTGGFEGDNPSDLQVAEADQGFALASPSWEIVDGCIDGISTDGNYTVFDVDDGTTNVDVYCDSVKPNTLAPLCDELEVDDCTHFQGRFFPIDHDIAGARELVVIRAEE